MTPTHTFVSYGTPSDASEVEAFLLHTIDANERLERSGKKKTPVCIWGRHGIGKTDLVSDIARKLHAPLVTIAPAQFEEMGDLLGMPVVSDDRSRTKMAPPEWVPRVDGPGIFLLDDINRADDRILRGLMQLLQNFELAAWRLPPRWQIVLTANPDGGDYSVTPMDDAMLTRMLHITLRFDVKRWAAWAERAGVDPRGIAFVLAYPETVTGARTTPRTLVQFFDRIASIDNLKEHLNLVTMLGEASLDKSTVAAFIAFVETNLENLVTPDEILRAKNMAAVEARIHKLIDGETKRVDVLQAVCTRLVAALHARKDPLTEAEQRNLGAFVMFTDLPDDVRLALAQDLALVDEKLKVARIFSAPALAQLLLRSKRS